MSVRVTLLKDRLWISLNKYKAFTKDSRNGGASVLATRPLAFDFTTTTDADLEYLNNNSPNTQDLFRWYFYRIWGDTSTAAAGLPFYNGTGDPGYMAQHGLVTAQQTVDYVYNLMGFSKSFVNNNSNLPSGTGRTATNDVTSKGYELEVNYRTKNWNLKITGADKQTIDANVAAALTNYITQRLPYLQNASFTNTTTGVTESYWTSPFGTNSTRRDTYYSQVLSVYEPLIANLGKPRPQLRRYTTALTTSYRLAGISENRVLKNIRVGGGGSWSSRAAIGYKYATPEYDAVANNYTIRQLDPNGRYYDKSRYTLNFFSSYDFRMFSGRVKSSLQFNVQNLQESGRLQPISVNSDGTPWAYRIIDPRVFQLTWSMDL